ncbi:hypothetical protein [Pelagicoccus sp. SDUM812002]|uniref:hypothetical protein n=1 Tax=Pelagicoccus sp. SDUM812002 TaxID=3041266 RepID=UPI00280D3774|nr:hypothetical protein [Pelagicoccus sp. SDUM812002]MDQ8188183.1 hypothetical protein [Pelagicoccus sp. SDUM812002]
MADSLIKKNKHGYGYGYGQGYGYGERVPLLPSGKRNLRIALIILFIGLGWLGYRFLIWHEARQLTASAISWERAEVEDAWEHLESVSLWAVDIERFKNIRLTLLLERDPVAAFTYAQRAIANEEGLEYKRPEFAWNALLLAAIRSQNWTGLEQSLQEVENRQTLPKDSPEVLTAQAWLELSKGESVKAWETLQDALERNPYDTEARLLRSELQTRSGDRGDRNQALVSLREIIGQNSSDSIRASMLLLSSGLLPTVEADWKTEIEHLAANPYLETHYLFARPAALRISLSHIRGRSPELSYRFAKQLSNLEVASAEEVAEYAFNAQELGELAEAEEAIATYRSKSEEQPLGLWLDTRQAWFNENLEVTLQGCRDGLRTAQATRFLPLLAAFAQDQDLAISDTYKRDALSLIIEYNNLTIHQWDFAARALWPLQEDMQVLLTKQALSWSVDRPLLASRFLIDHNRPQEALTALERLPTPQPSEAIELRFRALVLQGSYSEARTLLQDSTDVTPFTRRSGELMLALLVGNESEIKGSWDQAWGLAEKLRSPAAFTALGDLCFEYDRLGLALRAYKKAKSLAPALTVSPDSLRRFAQLLLVEKQTGEALDLIAQALFAEPASVELQRQWAYYSILLNNDLLPAKDKARALFDRRSEEADIAVTMAFAYLRTGQKARALALLEQGGGTRVKSNANRAILYAALVANGENERAEILRENIDLAALLPEEVALIEEYQPVLIEEIELPEFAEDARLIDLQNAKEAKR